MQEAGDIYIGIALMWAISVKTYLKIRKNLNALSPDFVRLCEIS